MKPDKTRDQERPTGEMQLLAALLEARTPTIDPERLAAESEATWRAIQRQSARVPQAGLLARLLGWRPALAIGALALLLGVLMVYGWFYGMSGQSGDTNEAVQVAAQDSAAERLVGGVDSLETARLASMTAKLKSILDAETPSDAEWRDSLSDVNVDDSSSYWWQM